MKELRLYVQQAPGAGSIERYTTNLITAGIALASPVQTDAGIVKVMYDDSQMQMQIGEQQVIASARTAAAGAGMLVISWQIVQWVTAVPSWVWISVGVGLVMLVLLGGKTDKEQ